MPAGNFNASNSFNNGVVYAFVACSLSSSMAAMVAVIAATCEYGPRCLCRVPLTVLLHVTAAFSS